VRRITVVACAAGLLATLTAAPARAQTHEPSLALVAACDRIGTPSPTASGIGVFPSGRLPDDFLRAIASGNERDRGAVARALRDARVGIEARGSGALVDAFAPAAAGDGHGKVFVVQSPCDGSPVEFPRADLFVIVEPQGNVRVPCFADVSMSGGSGSLYADDVRRAGIVTAYDVSATMLDFFGVSQASVAGTPMRIVARGGVDALRARLLRDAGADRGLSHTTAALGIAAGVLAVLFGWRRRRALAEAVARAGALVPAGHLAGMFVPSGRWYLRALPLVAAFALGLAWRARDTRKFCGVALFATAAVIAALTVAAALRPDGEPALSLWGDPLVSWRFFGLRNHLAAFVAGCALAGAALLGARRRALVAVTLAAGAVVGVPRFGANYIGVLTLVFGATLVVLFVARARAEWWHYALASALALAATAGALLSDAGSTHGARFVGAVRAGGLAHAWNVFVERARLDYREVARVGVAGFAGFVIVAVGMVVLHAWAVRAQDAPLYARAAVAGLAASSFLALFVEDSGFFTGGILALFPAIAFAIARVRTQPTPSPAAPITPPQPQPQPGGA
jgi:hypothetical protein